MEKYTADLHVHSRFSRATSKALTVRNLAAWARVKGVQVVGTGDFTHPGWLEEIETALEDDGSGLFRLRDEAGLERELPERGGPLPGRTRFMLQTEISSIYKKAGKVRKVHNLVYMPDLDAVRAFNQKLAMVGNLESDGRPILGLDSRDLLELVLETHALAFLIPAHIWTPWFSLFGAKSGFDSLEECFGDLSGEIFAMETGLSSDPKMNWLWSALDRMRLVSNSDAHSGEKLCREANVFRGELSYEGMYRALRGEGLGQSFLGTIEFFPEEGKYHLDGHRKCGVVMDPQESRARGGICPVCGRPVTMGVLSRILELADREEPVRPPNRPGFASLIPLKELIAEVLGAGPGTKKVLALYNRITADLGPELDVLQIVPAEDIAKYSRPLAEGVGRMREGRVLRTPGFDGQYGVISVFTDKERAEMTRGGLLIAPAARAEPLAGPVPDQAPRARETAPSALVHNPAQERAVLAGPNPVLVVAGPGTGKTQTLAGRVERLLGQGVDPKKILVVTFTRRAAQELRDRLRARLGPDISPPQAGTLHALAFDYWSHVQGEPPVVLDEESAKRVFAEANPKLPKSGLKAAWEALCLARQTMRPQDPDLAAAAANYSGHKSSWNLADYDDLLAFMLEQIASNGFAAPFSHVLVDEIQDLSALQLALVSSVARDDGKGFFAIGDPRQSIYGFRGALGDARAALKRRWPDIEVVELEDNYRSAQAILDLSGGLFPDAPRLRAQNDAPAEIHLFQAPDAMREAAWIAARVKSLIGATSHSLADATGHGGLAPGDVAVLVRFRGLTAILEKALTRQGVPCARPEAEAFWDDPRAAAILAAAGRFLGLPGKEDNGPDIPEPVLAGGPAGLASALRETPPFDRFFWEGRAFRELKRAFEQKRGWAGLLNWVHLQSGLELIGRSAEKVQIMSLHAAKGLEFEAVFMPCLEDGVLPFFGAETLTGKAPGSVPGQAAVLEEKRLFYVGLTRARQMLFMSHAASRTLYGRTLRLPPSRFLGELAPKLIKRTAMTAHSVKKEKRLSLLDTPSARTS